MFMLTLPLVTFFGLHDHLLVDWPQKTMYSGFGAVVMANIVILGYVLAAWHEEVPTEASRPTPRVGRFKTE